MSTETQDAAHKFESQTTQFCTAWVGGDSPHGPFCGQLRDAAIHRVDPASSGTAADKVPKPHGCPVCYYGAIAAGEAVAGEHCGLHQDASGTGEAPELKPRTIYALTPPFTTSGGGQYGNFWTEQTDANSLTEYILRTTHDAEIKRLREALRRIGHDKRNVESGIRMLCWCSNIYVCMNEPECSAARDALNAGKG